MTPQARAGVEAPKPTKKVPVSAPLLALLTLIILFALLTPTFRTTANLVNVLTLAPVLLIVSLGITFPIVLGGIDLSTEGIMALASISVGFLVTNPVNHLHIGFWSLPLTMLVGAAVGWFNGLIHVKGKIPSFMTTLGLGYVALGFAIYLIKGNPIPILDRRIQQFAIGRICGIPQIALVGLVAFAAALVIERWTSLGRYIFGIGGNETIAKQLGVPVDRVKIFAFVLAGGFYGLAGFLNAARLASGNATTSVGYQFSAITATVVGGTALTGGVGGAVSALLGTLIVTVLQNGMILLGVNPYAQGAIQGFVLIAAVTLTLDRKKLPFIK
ncbi:MAG: ABC transporter permease [Bacteroidota bacterium]